MRIMLLLVLLTALVASTYGQSYSLAGKVTDSKGNPLPGATVVLGNEAYTASCNEAGSFSFSGVKKGEYLLKVSFIGFATFRDTVLVQDDLSETVVVLKPRLEQLQEVVVEGSYAESIKKGTPLNVEIVNDEFIRNNLGGSLMKSLDRLPGVGAIEIGSGQSKPVIRGLSFNRVAVMENGIKHQAQQWGTEHGLEIDQYSVDRLEVIKGPASLTYGSDAIGGIIDIKKDVVPQRQSLGGSVNMSYKSNSNSVGGSVNIFGRNDRTFFDARFSMTGYGDFRIPSDHVNVYSFRVPLDDNRLRNTAGKEWAMHFSGGYIKDDLRSVFYISNTRSKNGFFANAHGLEPRNVDEEAHDRSHRDILKPYHDVNHFKLSNKTVKIWPGHKLQVETGFQRNLRSEWSDYVDHGYMPPVYPDELPVPYDLERRFDKYTFTLNARDEISMGRHRLSVGLNSEYQDNKVDGWGFIIPAFRQLTTGLFIYDKYSVNEKLMLHAGLRYDHGWINTEEYRDWFPSPSPGMGDSMYVERSGDLDRSYGNLSWAAGLNYNKEFFTLKANAGKSFRMPLAHELASNGVNYHHFSYQKGDSTLRPEVSYQADLTLELNYPKWAVQFSPFVNYFPNYIYLNPTPGYDYLYGAGNQVYIYTESEVIRFGGELHAHYVISKALKAGLIAEYIFSEQLSGGKTGFTLPFSPPPSVLLNLSYSPVLKSKVLAEPYFSADFRITAPQERIVPPERITQGYQVLNLSFGTKFKWGEQFVELNMQFQNLLNEKYFNHTSFYRLIDVPEPGRNFIVSVVIPVNGK